MVVEILMRLNFVILDAFTSQFEIKLGSYVFDN
jgi:hypothetical protein